MKSVGIRSFPGPCFPVFGLNTERYSVSLHIQSECGKIRTRKTPNTETFHAVVSLANRFGYKEKWIGVIFFQKPTRNSGKALIIEEKRSYYPRCALILEVVIDENKINELNQCLTENWIMLRLYQHTSIVNWSDEDHLACNSKMIHFRYQCCSSMSTVHFNTGYPKLP